MGGVKFRIHPLTIPFALYFSATGRFVVFAVYTVSAVIHELGHAFASAKAGYKLKKITLMPFGALISGDQTDFKATDEIKIALAGPLINLVVGLFFVSLWWFFPETYAFTDLAVEACFSLAIINLIPAYPLDGGRVLCASLACFMKRKRAILICKIIGVGFSLVILALFVLTCFNTVNLTLLFFGLFILFGAISRDKENAYVRLSLGGAYKKLKSGVAVKRVAVSVDTPIKTLLLIADPYAINEILVYDYNKKIATITDDELSKLLYSAKLYAPVGEYLQKSQ